MRNIKTFDLERAEELASDIASLEHLRNSRSRLFAAIADMHGLSLDELFGQSRTHVITHKRFRAYYILRQLGFSYLNLGRILNRDHSSVLYGVRCVKASLVEQQVAA